MSILDNIRRKSREEWLDTFRDKLTDLRIWIQEHPEKAFVVGVILGAVVVLFFKLVFWLVFILVVLGLAAYFYALPGQQMGRAADYVVRNNAEKSQTDSTNEGGEDAG